MREKFRRSARDERSTRKNRLGHRRRKSPEFPDWVVVNQVELTPEMIRNHQAGRTMMFSSCLSCDIEFGYDTEECPICGESLLAQRMAGC